jgi:YHS domain-containing protein
VIRILLLAILILLLARAFWRLIDGILEAAGGAPRRRVRTPGMKLVRDPVCGTFVAPGSGPSLQARGQTHYFCSEECRSRFQRTA